MKSAKSIILILLITFMHNAWSSLDTNDSFNIQAGTKKLIFKKNPKMEWRQFCFDTKMGCARFRFNNVKSDPIFGYIKIVTDQVKSKDFNKYCKEVFDISSSEDKTLNKFSVDTKSKSKIQHCSWMGQKDVIHFFWKDGFTIVVNTNDSFNVETLLSEAKFNEKL